MSAKTELAVELETTRSGTEPPVATETGCDLDELSPREKEVARLVAKGFSNKEAARLLQVSHWTVAAQLKAVFLKLGVRRRSELAYLLRHSF